MKTKFNTFLLGAIMMLLFVASCTTKNSLEKKSNFDVQLYADQFDFNDIQDKAYFAPQISLEEFEYAFITNLNSCTVGTVTRIWTSKVDPTHEVKQIMKIHLRDVELDLYNLVKSNIADRNINKNELDEVADIDGEIISKLINQFESRLLGISLDEEVVDDGILRKWRLLDWCSYSDENDEVIVEQKISFLK